MMIIKVRLDLIQIFFRLTGSRWIDYVKNILAKDNYNDTFADYNVNAAIVKRIPKI